MNDTNDTDENMQLYRNLTATSALGLKTEFVVVMTERLLYPLISM